MSEAKALEMCIKLSKELEAMTERRRLNQDISDKYNQAIKDLVDKDMKSFDQGILILNKTPLSDDWQKIAEKLIEDLVRSYKYNLQRLMACQYGSSKFLEFRARILEHYPNFMSIRGDNKLGEADFNKIMGDWRPFIDEDNLFVHFIVATERFQSKPYTNLYCNVCRKWIRGVYWHNKSLCSDCQITSATPSEIPKISDLWPLVSRPLLGGLGMDISKLRDIPVSTQANVFIGNRTVPELDTHIGSDGMAFGERKIGMDTIVGMAQRFQYTSLPHHTINKEEDSNELLSMLSDTDLDVHLDENEMAIVEGKSTVRYSKRRISGIDQTAQRIHEQRVDDRISYKLHQDTEAKIVGRIKEVENLFNLFNPSGSDLVKRDEQLHNDLHARVYNMRSSSLGDRREWSRMVNDCVPMKLEFKYTFSGTALHPMKAFDEQYQEMFVTSLIRQPSIPTNPVAILLSKQIKKLAKTLANFFPDYLMMIYRDDALLRLLTQYFITDPIAGFRDGIFIPLSKLSFSSSKTIQILCYYDMYLITSKIIGCLASHIPSWMNLRIEQTSTIAFPHTS